MTDEAAAIKAYLSRIGRKGGAAGKGAAKARPSGQAAAAGRSRWLCRKVYAWGALEKRCDRRKGHEGPCSGDAA